MMDNKPLSIRIESFKTDLNIAFGQIAEKHNLPAYLMEGCVAELLMNVKSQKSYELIMDIANEKEGKEDDE